MLRPQDTRSRERKQITGLWDFCLDPEDVGVERQWFKGPLPGACKMAVPASFNDIFPDRSIRGYIGPFWYQTVVKVPAGWRGEDVGLYFESVTHRAQVWVDGVQAAEHEGGYLPFEADLTDRDPAGRFVRVTVRGDNTLSFQTIPPGTVRETAGGKRQLYWHDFFNYAGIHRPVWLYAAPRARFCDITVTTELDGSAGLVSYTAVCRGAEGCKVKVRLLDAQGSCRADGEGDRSVLRVENAHLWAPGDGYLYMGEFTLWRGGELVDEYTLRIGIRTVRVAGTRFLINDRPFTFRGFGTHEDIGILGKAHNDAYMLADFARMKWVGANSFRTSHYPYSEDVLDYADEQGIVVIDETAAVGLNLLGAQIFPGEEMQTFSPRTIDGRTGELHRTHILELIARDKNHPCVAVWSLANEPESQTEAAEGYFRPLFQAAREADPTRPIGFVNMMLGQPGTCRVAQFADLIMLNRYYGWYVETGDLAEAKRLLRRELEGWKAVGKPVIMTEYGADAIPGLHQMSGAPWSEEFQVELLRAYHEVMDECEAVVGEQVWNYADFATAPGTMRVGGNRKGVFTRDREPKMAAYFLRQRWRGEGEPSSF